MEPLEVDEELDAVEAVYGEDVVEIERGNGSQRRLLIRINPDVAGHEALIHASLLVQISLPEGYPAEGRAEAVVENMAGVPDQERGGLEDRLAEKIRELEGDQCLFELLQSLKDFVNDHNVPADDCCICMCEFSDDEPYVMATCSHAFHCECLARWIHDQRVQAQDRASETPERGGGGGKTEGGGARCAVCRQEIGEDRVLVLEDWLKPLWEEHERDRRERGERERIEKEVADEGERLRRQREQQEKERREMSEFRPQPLVVLPGYRHNNLKVLRHAVLPLGATDSRIVRIGEGREATFLAAVWFAGSMEKAERAVRSLAREGARIASYRDTKMLPPDFVRAGGR